MGRSCAHSKWVASLRLGAASNMQVVPSKGTDTTLDTASWNIEWFGDTSNGPTNEALQLQNARAVIAGADMDIWGVAEIVSLAQWNNLKAQLPGYAGFIAKEPNVVNGRSLDEPQPGRDGHVINFLPSLPSPCLP